MIDPLRAAGIDKSLRDEDEPVKAAEQTLHEISHQAALVGAPCGCVCVVATWAHEENLKAAQAKRGCDLIRMASQGKGMIAGLFPGSETSKVAARVYRCAVRRDRAPGRPRRFTCVPNGHDPLTTVTVWERTRKMTARRYRVRQAEGAVPFAAMAMLGSRPAQGRRHGSRAAAPRVTAITSSVTITASIGTIPAIGVFEC